MRLPVLAAALLFALPAAAQLPTSPVLPSTPATPSTPAATDPAPPAPAAASPAALPSTPAHPTTARHGRRRTQAQRFEEANTTHDGKLTLDQARAAHMNAVVRDFADIDSAHHGYVTLANIRDHRRAVRAAHRAASANKG